MEAAGLAAARFYNASNMQLRPFALERYFARYEFSARYLLSSSDCDGPSLQGLLDLADDESRSLWASLSLGYTESQGLPALRREIVGLYRAGPAGRTDEADVLCVVPEEGVLLVMLALVRPGDRVVCTYPGYQSLYEVAAGLGAEVVFWKAREDERWRFHPADLARCLQGEARLVVWNFPHNPTGALPTEQDYEEMIRAAEEAGALIFSDEMYRWLELPGHPTLPSAAEASARAVVLGGLSKSFGLAGLRSGWLLSPDRNLLSACAALKDYTTICAAAPSEVLALAALRARRRILQEHCQRIQANRSLALDFARRHPDFMDLVPPAGGSVCFPRLRRPEGARSFCECLAERAGIMLLPSTVYEYGDSHVRLGLGRSDFPAALERLESYLDGKARAAG